jgi:hypothetical protein
MALTGSTVRHPPRKASIRPHAIRSLTEWLPLLAPPLRFARLIWNARTDPEPSINEVSLTSGATQRCTLEYQRRHIFGGRHRQPDAFGAEPFADTQVGTSTLVDMRGNRPARQ